MSEVTSGMSRKARDLEQGYITLAMNVNWMCPHTRRTSHTIVHSIVAIKWLQIIPYTTSKREGSHC